MNWMRFVVVTSLLLVTATASAVPVRVNYTYWEWHFDHAVTSDMTTNRDLQIGDCRVSCRGTVDGLEYISGTRQAPVVSRSSATMHTTSTLTDDFTAFSALATLEVFAAVDANWENGGAIARAGLQRFITEFEVLEPVFFSANGVFGLSHGSATYSPSDPTIASGTWLQPGVYFNSLSFADIGTDDWHTDGIFTDSHAIGLDYHFSRVPVPAPAPLALVALGLLAMVGARRRA